jgi:hypothetical protein
MTTEAPLAAVRAELSPEFHQFAIGTGDVLTAAEQLNQRRPGNKAVTSSDTCMLFTLEPGIAEVKLVVEVWAAPQSPPPAPVQRFTRSLRTDGELLQIVSITPSPKDVTLALPSARDYTFSAYLTEVSQRYDDVFDLHVRTENWVVHIW